MSSFSSDDGKYRLMQANQTFFKSCIELILAGNEDKLREVINEFYQANKASIGHLQEIFMSFQSEGKTLVHIAASSGHSNIFNYITANCDIKPLINNPDNKGFTPLIHATISENDEIIKNIIDNGANVNHCNEDGAAAAHFAAGDGNINRLTLLEKAGADLNLMSKSGSLLHWAAGKGRSDMIQYLVNKGVNINSLASTGLPAVLLAAVAGNDKSVSIFVKAGADIGHIISGNLTLLHICAENGLLESVQDIVGTETGRNCCNIATNDGNLPIHLAAMAGHRAIAELLIPLSSHGLNSNNIEDIMNDGKVRMRLWEENNATTTSNSNVTTNSVGGSDRVLESVEPAATPDALQKSEEWKDIGNKHYIAKQYHEAIKAYTEAIKCDGSNKMLWSNRSACYLVVGAAKDALLDAEVCRKLDSTWAKACYRLASARLALDMFEDAALAAFEGCKIESDNQELKKLLNKCVELGRQDHQKKLAAGKA